MPDFDSIAKAIFELDEDKVVALVEQTVKEGVSPEDIINNGLIAGIEKVGVLFKRGDIFVPEVLAATAAMKNGLSIVEPYLKGRKLESRGLVILGTVRGDIHDIGRRLVGTMLETGGFDIVDLGNDVAEEVFVEKVSALKPQIVGLSALLNTTMLFMKTTIDALREAGCRDQVKVIVGGSTVTPGFTEKIGADGTASDAIRAVDLAKSLLKV
jgi:5-methyltetrahydrofolate--homocysteine methyltransferase